MSIPSDWVEHCADGGTSPSNFASEYNQSHAQMVYDIPFGYFPQQSNVASDSGTAQTFDNGAVNIFGYILGYSDVNADGSMTRFLPLQHPYLNGLYATKILSAVPMAHGARDANGNPNGIFFSVGNNNTPFAWWHFARTTIYYQTLPYVIMTDTALKLPPFNGQEQWRYTLPKWEGGIRSLNFGKKGGAIWAEGGDSTQLNPIITNLQPVKNEAYADLVWWWYRVPARGLFTFSGNLPLIPTNITKVVGTVNQNTWPGANGFPPQTLLCLPPKFHEQMYPVSPGTLALQGSKANNDLPVLYDVEFRFKWYDPQPLDVGPPAATTRGHNLAATKRGSYAKFLVGNPAGGIQPMFQSSDFNQLFTLNAPT